MFASLTLLYTFAAALPDLVAQSIVPTAGAVGIGSAIEVRFGWRHPSPRGNASLATLRTLSALPTIRRRREGCPAAELGNSTCCWIARCTINGIDVRASLVPLVLHGAPSYAVRYVVHEGDASPVAEALPIDCAVDCAQRSNADRAAGALCHRRVRIDALAPVLVSVLSKRPVATKATVIKVDRTPAIVGTWITVEVETDTPKLRLDAATGCTINNQRALRFLDLGRGLYTLDYRVKEGDLDQHGGMLPIACVFIDAGGNTCALGSTEVPLAMRTWFNVNANAPRVLHARLLSSSGAEASVGTVLTAELYIVHTAVGEFRRGADGSGDGERDGLGHSRGITRRRRRQRQRTRADLFASGGLLGGALVETEPLPLLREDMEKSGIRSGANAQVGRLSSPRCLLNGMDVASTMRRSAVPRRSRVEGSDRWKRGHAHATHAVAAGSTVRTPRPRAFVASATGAAPTATRAAAAAAAAAEPNEVVVRFTLEVTAGQADWFAGQLPIDCEISDADGNIVRVSAFSDHNTIAGNAHTPTLSDYIPEHALALGFVVVAFAAHAIARGFPAIGLPRLSGYLLVGVVAGPSVLHLIPESSIRSLRFVDEVSLAFIAVSAGAKLYIPQMRPRVKSISSVMLGLIVSEYAIVTATIFALHPLINFMRDMEFTQITVVALMAGTLVVARSPATAIAVTKEVGAEGPFTSTVLGVTVLSDVAVIALFALTSLCSNALVSNRTKAASVAWVFLAQMCISVLLGVAMAAGLACCLRPGGGLRGAAKRGQGRGRSGGGRGDGGRGDGGSRARGEGEEGAVVRSAHPALRVLRGTLDIVQHGAVVVSGFGMFVLSHVLDPWVDPLVACMTAGFVVVNYASPSTRERLYYVKDNVGPMVHVAFFTLTGAALNLRSQRETLFVSGVVFFGRIVGIVAGSYVGGRFAGEPERENRVAWMAYVTQAGVTLGLAKKIHLENRVWGSGFATIIIATVVINQLVGPPLLRWALAHVGEAGRAAAHVRANDADDGAALASASPRERRQQQRQRDRRSAARRVTLRRALQGHSARRAGVVVAIVGAAEDALASDVARALRQYVIRGARVHVLVVPASDFVLRAPQSPRWDSAQADAGGDGVAENGDDEEGVVRVRVDVARARRSVVATAEECDGVLLLLRDAAQNERLVELLREQDGAGDEEGGEDDSEATASRVARFYARRPRFVVQRSAHSAPTEPLAVWAGESSAEESAAPLPDVPVAAGKGTRQRECDPESRGSLYVATRVTRRAIRGALHFRFGPERDVCGEYVRATIAQLKHPGRLHSWDDSLVYK